MKQKLIVFALALSTLLAACGGPEVVDAVLVCGTSGDQATFEGTLNRNTAEFIVPGGVRVILKTTPGNPVVAVRLFVDGGTRNLTPETAGIETFALDVATSGGTESMTRAELTAALDAMGSGVGSSAVLDFSTLQASSLRVFFEDTWSIFRDVLEAPAFPDTEIERLRQQHLQALLMRRDNPDDRVVDSARELLFTDHPYGNLPRGTTETIGGFTRDQLVAYYESLFQAERMLLVVVGDMTQLELTAIIGDTFVNASTTSPRPEPPPPFPDRDMQLRIDEASIPTNYIIGLAPAPSPTDPDFAAMILAMSHLSDRLFEEVRTARNLSYAVSANIGTRLANYAYFYVTAVDPAATIPVIYDEMRSLRDELLEPRDLQDQISVFITQYYTQLDSNGAVAAELGWWELFGGGREHADSYTDLLRSVTVEDVQRVAAEYLHDFQVAVVGDPSSVDEQLFSGP